jgi:hypothetical protein
MPSSVDAAWSVDAPKADRVDLPWRLPAMIEVQRDCTWHDIVILDEPGLFGHTDPEFIELRRDEKFLNESDTWFSPKTSY